MMTSIMHYIVLSLCSFLALLGCREGLEPTPENVPPPGYLELLEAYQEEKVFLSAESRPESCLIRFSDGSGITIPASSFKVDDCTEKLPSEVSVVSGWWSVDGLVKGIKADSTLPDEEAVPVYVYFDSTTLHMYLSNRKFLEFRSVVLEEQKNDIPVVYITTAGKAQIKDKKNYVDGTITIVDAAQMYTDGTEFKADMGIRGRGNSTWGWPKKPWKVKLDEKASLLGMPADKEWALLANYSDRTLMRNIVAMKLSEICGFSWTPRMRSVEVYLNDEYQGVYTLCEHKKVSEDRVDIDVVAETDNDYDSVQGGYYLEMEENQDETTCWWTSMGVPMMFSDPEEPTAEQYEYICGYIDYFEELLRTEQYGSESGYPMMIDVPSFVNYYIVQELTKNVDGNLRKSTFLTKERGKKMEMYHLWDFDLTLGNCGYFDWKVGNGPENFWIRDYASNSTYGGGWFWYLFKDPAFVKAVQERWDELMPELRKIPDFIDEQARMLERAQKRNFERWDINVSVDWVKMPSLGSYVKEVEYLKTFYNERLEWLDRELRKL